MMRALAAFDVNVIGLTLSRNQHAHVQRALAGLETIRDKRVLLQGWEQFDEPVDRIVSIGAFEHFGADRWAPFFATAHRVLPTDGIMLLHTITRLTLDEVEARGIPLSMDAARFAMFVAKEIFPGGQLPAIEAVEKHAAAAGFTRHSSRAKAFVMPSRCSSPAQSRSASRRHCAAVATSSSASARSDASRNSSTAHGPQTASAATR